MGFASQWKGINQYIITSPETVFSKYDETHGIGYPIAFILMSMLAAMVPLTILVVGVNITSPSDIAVGLALMLGFAVAAWVAVLIEGLIAHGILLVFGAHGATKTLDAYAFPVFLRNVLWWFPIVNIGLGLYGLLLQIKGMAAFHDISTSKAAIAAVLAAIFSFIPLIVVFAAVIATFVLSFGEQPPDPQPALLLFGL